MNVGRKNKQQRPLYGEETYRTPECPEEKTLGVRAQFRNPL